MGVDTVLDMEGGGGACKELVGGHGGEHSEDGGGHGSFYFGNGHGGGHGEGHGESNIKRGKTLRRWWGTWKRNMVVDMQVDMVKGYGGTFLDWWRTWMFT